MTTIPLILTERNGTSKCTGESPSKFFVCSTREQCARYMHPSGKYQAWRDFWMAGENCVHSLTIPKVGEAVVLE